MLKYLQNLIISVIEDLTADPHDTVGLVLLFLGYNTVIAVNLAYKKEWDAGSKGSNGFWDIPEQILTLCKWYFPLIVMAACFLPDIVKPPDMAWWFMLGVIFFGLTGRWGLEWLERMKGTVTSVFTKKTEIKQTVNESIDESKMDSTGDTPTGGK